MAEVEIGNLKVLNVTKTLGPSGAEDTWKFSVPSGGVGLLKEATCHLFRGGASTPMAQPGNTSDPFTSDLVRVKSLEVTKVGASERTNLVSGTPNIKEFCGDGKLSKLFTVIETLENNEDVLMLIHNDDSVQVEISISLWFAVKPRERRIAAQPENVPVRRDQ